MAYSFFCPTRVLFSDDAAADLERELKARTPAPLFIVTDAGLVNAGIVEPFVRAASAAGHAPTVYTDVPSNPGVDCVRAAAEAARGVTPAHLLAIGGGSPIDVAKAVSILLTHPGVTWEDLQANRASISQPGVPVIAVPTTAGTGSEVSHVTVIGATDGFKRGILHNAIFPSLAIVDGGLAAGLPPAVTAATGMDAIVHAIEAYLGNRANPSMDLLAISALRAAVKSLPTVVRDGRNRVARQAMAHAATWAGMAMDQAGLGVCHALCGPVSNHFEVHHGLGNAVLLPAVLAFNAPAIREERWPVLRHALDLPREASPADLAGWARGFLGQIGLPCSLRELGVDPASFPELAAEAMRMAMVRNNVRPVTEADCLAVLQAAL